MKVDHPDSRSHMRRRSWSPPPAGRGFDRGRGNRFRSCERAGYTAARLATGDRMPGAAWHGRPPNATDPGPPNDAPAAASRLPCPGHRFLPERHRPGRRGARGGFRRGRRSGRARGSTGRQRRVWPPAGLYVPGLPWDHRLQERLPELQGAPDRRPVGRVPGPGPARVPRRQPQASDHAGPGPELLGPGHRRPRRLPVHPQVRSRHP